MMTRARRGVTLIELLTVLGIASLLALLVLPSVKTMLTDRKGTQSATMVRNFLEAARARAVGSGVPVAVVFERLSSQPADLNQDGLINDADLSDKMTPPVTPARLISATSTDPLPTGSLANTNFLPYNACIRLSMAEQPLPITDEMIPQPGLASLPRVTFYRGTSMDAPPSIVKPGMDYFYCRGGGANPVLKSFLIAGSEISLNLSSSRHMIMETATKADLIDNTISNLWFTFPASSSVTANLEQSIPSSNAYGTGTTNFTIFPKPRPINGPTVQLPKGTCVDLSISGFSTKGNIVDLSKTPSVPRDQRMRFSSTWLYASSAVPSAQELRPIYVVFTPDGGMSRVYANSMLSGSLVPVETADDFFLHVGKTDQVLAIDAFFNVNAPAAIDTSIPQNLIDPSTYVLRLSPKSGAISAAPLTLAPVSLTATVGDVLTVARQGTYGAQLTAQ
jgi:prepilin-type N-terminal cleavage/methylation domain-containing protein